jgi:hypothetical protein
LFSFGQYGRTVLRNRSTCVTFPGGGAATAAWSVAFCLTGGFGADGMPFAYMSALAEKRTMCKVRLLTLRPSKYRGSWRAFVDHPPPAPTAFVAGSS